jgi:hypothetical protein
MHGDYSCLVSIAPHSSCGRTKWDDRSPAIDLALQSAKVRQAIAVGKHRKSVVPDDTIDLALCLGLDVRGKCHGEIKCV